MDYLKIAVIAIIVIVVAKFLLRIAGKELRLLIANEIVGLLLIYLINISGLLAIKINLLTALVVGVFGVPGVVILIVLTILGVL